MTSRPSDFSEDGQSPDRKTVVLGVGNILYGDEGVGVYAARALEDCYRFTPEIEIVDGATIGFHMMDIFSRASTLIVLDALATDSPAGSIFRIPTDQLSKLGPEFQPTAHEVDPLHLFKIAPLIGYVGNMVLIGIVPFNTSEVSLGLSSQLSSAFPAFLDTVLSELQGLGMKHESLAAVSIDKVVESLTSGVR